MRNTIAYLILLMVFCILGCGAHRPNNTQGMPSGIGVRHAGDLVTVTKDEVVLSINGENHVFIITEKTRLLVSIDDLKPGDPVNVLTTLEDEKTALELKKGYLEFKLNP